MAFPTIPTVANGRVIFVNQTGTSATKTFPSLTGLTKNAGDLLIAFIACYNTSVNNAVFSSWGAGFTEIHDTSTANAAIAVGVAYKWSTGSETGTFTVNATGTLTGETIMIVVSIPGAHATTPPEAGARVSTGAAAPDSGSFSPSWGADDTLWIQFAANGETSTAGSWVGITGAPTNYTDTAGPTPVSDIVGSMDAYVAFRQNNAASEDPGPWTVDTSNTRSSAVTVAVRPPAPPPALSGSWGESWS